MSLPACSLKVKPSNNAGCFISFSPPLTPSGGGWADNWSGGDEGNPHFSLSVGGQMAAAAEVVQAMA